MNNQKLSTTKIKDWHICLIIYFLALGITLGYALTKTEIISDKAIEYLLYLEAVKSGSWHFVTDNIVNSCLMITYIPAIIQRITHIDATLLFKIYPCFFYSLMPMFVYLTSRKYLNIWYSLISAFLILSNFYFLYNSFYTGRVGLAWAFFAGLIWAVLNQRFVWSLVLSILIIFSHYGTAYVAIIILGTAWLVSLIIKRKWNKEYLNFGIVLAVLIAVTLVWHGAIARESGRYTEEFVKSALTLEPTKPEDITEKYKQTTSPDQNPVVTTSNGQTSETQSVITSSTPDTEKSVITQRIGTIFELEYKESVVQVAFGKTLPYMNIPQKIEFVLSWLIVLLLTGGLLAALLRNKLSDIHAIMAVTVYGLIVLTVAIPYLSVFYGISRVYFTAMAIIAPCFAMGTQEVSKLLKINGYILPAIILVVYALCVSGIMHSWFGIVK